jgi:hypothetical protein
VPEPGDPQHFNRYSYVRNNPVKYSDPTGHADWVGDYCEGGEEHPSHKETHSSHVAERLVHGVAEFIHAYEGYHALTHGVKMALGGLELVPGATYAGQMIVYGTFGAKAAAGLPTHLTHARAATHSGLVPYTNPWAAAGKVIQGRLSAVALGIVYGVDFVEYQVGHHDGSKLVSSIAVDTGITLGPPATGALFGSAIMPGPGTAIGTGVGYIVSIGWSLLGREATIDFVDEHIVTPLGEGLEKEYRRQLQTGGRLQWWNVAPLFTFPQFGH